MSEIISDAGLLKSTRARFGTRGFDEASLSSDIVRVWDISDLPPPYHNKSGGSMFLSQAAVAAAFSYAGLLCPGVLPANYRMVITSIMPLGAACTVGILDANSGTFATLALTQAPIQFSWDGLARPAANSLLGSNALSSGVNQWSFLAAAAGQVPAQLKYVLSPGQAFLCQSNALNTLSAMCFYWDEYYIG